MASWVANRFNSARSYFATAWSSYPKGFMVLILAAWGIPALYTLANTFYIGRMEMEAIAISEQYENVSVILEILLETFPLAVLALVAWNMTNAESVARIVRSAILMQLTVTIAFMALILVGASLFVETINTPIDIRDRTIEFLRIKAIAIPFESIGLLFIVSIKAMRRGWLAVGIAAVGVLVNFTLDSFVISTFSFSFRLGLIGSAWDYVASKIIIFFVAGYAFYRTIRARPSARFDRKESSAILKIGRYTGLESAVRNAGYILGMLIVLNTLGTAEYGGYGVAMTIMWLIFLIPVLALGEATNVAIGNEYGKNNLTGMKRVQVVSLVLMSTYMATALLLGVSAWKPLSAFFNKNSTIVDWSVSTFNFLAIPYFFFAVSSALKSLFIGSGRTLYYLIPSAAVNLGIYIPLGMLVKAGAYTPAFSVVMGISFLVFVADAAISAFLVYIVYRKLRSERERGIVWQI
jgi:Na+-driven multidrug efflux pump